MENRKLQGYDYYAEFQFGESEYREFSAIGYRQCLRMSVYILLLYIGYLLYCLLYSSFFPTNPVFHIAYLAFTVIVYFVNESRLKNAPAKELSRWDKPYRQYLVTFGENIAVRRDGTEKVYLYDEVKKVFATDNLYCLYLVSKTCIIIKRPLTCCCSITDFPAFLADRCKRLRSPKVYDLNKTKKQHKTVFIITVVFIALCLVFVALPATVFFSYI